MKRLLYAASLAAFLAAAPAWAQQAQPGSGSLSAEDQQFIKAAGEGNFAEAQLGGLASQRAPNGAVKEFGRWMVSAHGFANRVLATITEPMAGESVQNSLNPDSQATMRKLQGLSGTHFERAYLAAMVEDHEKDLKAFENEAQNGQDQSIKTYAQQMVPLIQQHLTEAKDLRSDLFHVSQHV